MDKRRIVFINLHGNEFLVKTLNKIIFGQSAAVKHKYLLDYLLDRDDIEVCSFITKRGLSLSYTTQNAFLQSFRLWEHRKVLKENGIDRKKVTLIKNENDLRPNDILVAYSYYAPTQICFENIPDAIRIICQIHFGTQHSELEKLYSPHTMYNEADLGKYSGMWRRDLPWYNNGFITIPFVFQDRFKRIKPFKDRRTKAVGIGTITYMHNITDFYGDPCAQPTRRNCRELGKEREDLIDSFNFDYLEDQQEAKAKSTRNPISKIYRRLYNKFFTGHQKQYFSFNMVDKFNDYKIAVVGEEIMGIPGIGFVEAMACGCAYIGQTVGYYEDYGMQEGVHYIGYDGSKEDLVTKLEYWERPENQTRLEEIANAGYEFVHKNFNKDAVARNLTERLLTIKK